jgi:hypothetical protein
MEKEKFLEKKGLFLFLIFLGFFFLISQERKPLKKEELVSLTTPSLELVEEKPWKEFVHQETGLYFKYPSEWQDFSLVLSTSFGQNSLHWEGYGGKEESMFERPFRFLLYFKDYFAFNFANFAFNATSVNPDWDALEFSKKMGLPLERIFFVEKLSDKSILVAFCDDIVLNPYESIPELALVVLTPFDDTYPNLEIRIRYDFYQDPVFKGSFDNLSSEERYSTFLSLLKEIAKKVRERSYSPELNYLIDSAQFVADSLKKI